MSYVHKIGGETEIQTFVALLEHTPIDKISKDLFKIFQDHFGEMTYQQRKDPRLQAFKRYQLALLASERSGVRRQAQEALYHMEFDAQDLLFGPTEGSG